MKKYQILVRLKTGVLDVQGKAVEQGVKELGFKNIDDVRVGKLIEFEIEDGDNLDTELNEICTKLLSNPVIEDFEIKEVG